MSKEKNAKVVAKVTTKDLIAKSLKGLKKGRTVFELADKTGKPLPTIRSLMKNFVKLEPRKCKSSGKVVSAYALAA